MIVQLSAVVLEKFVRLDRTQMEARYEVIRLCWIACFRGFLRSAHSSPGHPLTSTIVNPPTKRSLAGVVAVDQSPSWPLGFL